MLCVFVTRPSILVAGGYCFLGALRVGLWVCTSLKMVRLTSNKDQNVHILGRVCQLCLTQQIFLLITILKNLGDFRLLGLSMFCVIVENKFDENVFGIKHS